jgi:hypothetical protein
MKSSRLTATRSLLCLLAAVFLVPSSSAFAQTAPPKATLRVGAASATVNPPDGTFLAGYDLNRKSTGIHDDLYAKAVVFDDGQNAVALLVVDAISLQYDTVQQIRQAAITKVKDPALTPERIIAQATHSHGAPDTIGIYGPDIQNRGVSPEYMKSLVETAAEQIARACAARQPATLRWAKTECSGWAVNDSEAVVLDNSVTILECLDGQGKQIATLTNFACHPTVLDGDNTLVTADWVGAFYKTMAAALPGEHLFLQGGVGGWVQPQTPERTFALAEKYGSDLAEKSLTALKEAKPLQGNAVRSARQVFRLPVPNPVFKLMAATGLLPRDFTTDSVETEVAWFAVGDAQFATHIGETAPDFTFETRKLMDSEPKFVLGLGLDHLGYILPTRFFDQAKDIPFAQYQTSMSPGREAGAAMLEALAKIIP